MENITIVRVSIPDQPMTTWVFSLGTVLLVKETTMTLMNMEDETCPSLVIDKATGVVSKGNKTQRVLG